MTAKSRKKLVSEKAWQLYSERLRDNETAQALHRLFDYITDALATRIDDIETFEDKAILFFSAGREIIRINIGRHDLRVYVHPPAGALFEPEAKFPVEKISLWKSSYRKASGKYCGMSFWISGKEHLTGAKKIIDRIPRN